MPYILPPHTLSTLSFLRNDYQKEKKVDFTAKHSAFGWPTFLGGVDIITRNQQTMFLEKMLTYLKPKLQAESEIQSLEHWETHITASRIMLAAVLYVKDQLSGSKERSTLYNLINSKLGITQENDLDEEDKQVCYLAAQRVFTTKIAVFDEVNAFLKEHQLPSFTEQEWRPFINFLCEKSVKQISSTNYPITSVTQPLCSAVFAYTGATLGMIAGDIIADSTKALSTKAQLTAYIGGTLLIFSSAGPAGVALFAPAIAERLISTFCTISLTHIFGCTMGMLGAGVGAGVGMPLDLSLQLICRTCHIIGSSLYPTQKALITGIRIKDGVTMFGGIPIEEIKEKQIPEGCIPKHVTIKDGQLFIDGQEIQVPETGIQLTSEMVLRLKEEMARLNPEQQEHGALTLVPH